MKITGRQLTVMVVAVCAAAVLTPAAVSAATGSLVNITDPVTASQKARVVGGALKVSDGSGAVTVDGVVVTKDAVTTWAATSPGLANNGTDRLLLRQAAALVGVTLGTLTMSHESGTGPVDVRVRSFQPSTAGNCAGGGTVKQEIASFVLPQDDTRTVTWAPAFRVKKQSVATCIIAFVFGSGTHSVAVTATGGVY